jgi:hypothetical protein
VRADGLGLKPSQVCIFTLIRQTNDLTAIVRPI